MSEREDDQIVIESHDDHNLEMDDLADIIKGLALQFGRVESSHQSTNKNSYFLSSKFSDLTVSTEDAEFKVHKMVLCGRSEYFSRLFNGNWAVSIQICAWQERL